MTNKIRKLNLGCGKDIREGWENLDCVALPGVNIVHDLNRLPLPLESGIYDEVACQDVLEHIEFIPLLKEIHRILVPGGKVRIQVPHFTSRNNYDDPTHRYRFSMTSFAYFTQNHSRGGYYFDFHFSEIKDVKVLFEKSKYLMYNYIIEWLFPLIPVPRFLYEGTFLRALFPAETLCVTLVK